MYLHLGRNVEVSKESIIGIFDLDNASTSHITREYLYKSEDDGFVTNISDDLPKSFVICMDMDNEKERLYLSQLASSTLLKRFNEGILGIV